MASIRKRPRKDGITYSVLYTIEGRQSSLPFDVEKAAEAFKAAVDAHGAARALEMYGITAAARRASGVMTVKDWLDRHNGTLTGVDPGTVKRYRAYVRNDIAPAFGSVPLSALSRDDIAEWVNVMAEDGYSGKTIKNKRDYLSGALKRAVKAGHIPANPCEDVAVPRWDRQEMTFLTRAEFDLLLSTVPEHWRPLVEFLVASCCRWSEATALTPAAVDRKSGAVRITKAWKTGAGGYRLGVPKTKRSVRTVIVPTHVLDKLDYSGEWLFTNSGRGRRNTNGPVRIHSFHPNVWVPARQRAQAMGLTKSPRIHDLRHTGASWLIQAGVPMPTVQRHLGHESIQTTVDVYTHIDRTNSQLVSDAMARVLSGGSQSCGESTGLDG